MSDQDFDFAAYEAEVETPIAARVFNAIEKAGKTVNVKGDLLVVTNDHGEVSFAAEMVEHNGELALHIPETKWFAKFSNWAVDADFTAYVEQTTPESAYRIYCA